MLKWLQIILILSILNIPNVSVVAQDSVFSMWQLQAISFTPAVASITRGDNNVVVAVIDSGIDFNHYDLGTQLKYTNPGELPGNGIDDDHNGYVDDVSGWNFVDNNANTTPVPLHIDTNNNGVFDQDVSHGTSIAGIIAGQGQDVLGIVPNIKILDVKIYNSDGASYSVEKAINYVYNLSLRDHRIKVINYSGVISNNGQNGLNTTLNKLMQNNVMIVASAGNNYNLGTYNVSYPASYPGVISVGSVDNSLNISSFSQRGSNLDFVAPGENVFSLAINNQIDNNLDGTSYAAPFYTGAIAFIDSLQYKKPLTNADIFNLLKNSTTDLGPKGWDPTYGYGLLNMTKLVENLKPLLKQTLPSFDLNSIVFFIVFLVITIVFQKRTKLKK